MQFGIIVQARMGSKRFPGKVLKKYKGVSILKVLIDKLKFTKMGNKLIVATTKNKNDKKIIEFCKKNNVQYFIGSTNNVLERYYKCAKKYNIKNIIRLTADCPFIDLSLLKRMSFIFNRKNFYYLSNTYPLPCKYPDGSDIEIFTFKALTRAFLNAELPSEKEHVTNFFYKKKSKKIKRIDPIKNLSNYRYTIDNKNDFKIFKRVIDEFDYKKILKLRMGELVKFLDKNPNLTKYQRNIKRNYGWKNSILKDQKFMKLKNR